MLTVKGIRKSYEGRWLLDRVNLDVADGDIVGLLGASGSGKSTLLRIIAGLEQADDGQIFWDNRDISHLEPHKRGFGLMFQDYALFPHRTVAENIAFGLKMQGISEEESQRRVTQGLETIRMKEFANRPVTELSGGEQQRVALARALAPDPRLLMLDEPLGALDHALRVELMQELRRVLDASGKPAIYVTHDREEAFAVADRLAVLHDGVIVQAGPPQDLFDHPASAWIASFLALGNLIPASGNPDNPFQVITPLGVFTLREPCVASESKKGNCVLLLRPQLLRLDEPEMPGFNTFTARVVDSVFMGEYWQIQLENSSIMLEARSDRAYPKNAEIKVSVAPEKLQLLRK